jgi:hypothetical protein
MEEWQMATEIINGEEWEVFEHLHHKHKENLAVTLLKDGQTLSFNSDIFTTLGEPERVSLFYNRKQHQMAIQKAEPDQLGTLVRQAGVTYVIATRAFTVHYEIDTTVSRRYDAVIRDGVLVIDLNSGKSVTRKQGE